MQPAARCQSPQGARYVDCLGGSSLSELGDLEGYVRQRHTLPHCCKWQVSRRQSGDIVDEARPGNIHSRLSRQERFLR